MYTRFDFRVEVFGPVGLKEINMRVRSEPHRGTKPSSFGPHHCDAVGCKRATQATKSFCSEHVVLNSYAHKVLARMAQREEEDAIVAAGSSPPSDYNVKGVTAREILQELAHHGPRTRKRICRELSLEREVLDGYADALLLKKLIVEGTTTRGGATLALRRP
jgi:predicted phage gp36 major capsid-like protein